MASRNASNEQRASDQPLTANYAHNNFVIGAGVAIFHLASSRVVVIRHPVENVWFLPKGRRDVHEDTKSGAEREGFEESGYRNRALPIPIRHRQPQPRIPIDPRLSDFAAEPVWLQLMPQSSTSQYLLFWYVAETVPPDVEAALTEAEAEAEGSSLFGAPYQYPPNYPSGLKLKDRIAMEPAGFEPKRHENVGADAEEALYESHLLSIDEARSRLRGTVQEDVVRKGWEAIQLRMNMEERLT